MRCVLVWASIANYHRRAAYTQLKCISRCSGGWKPEIRVPAWGGSGASPLLGCGLLTSLWILTEWGEVRERSEIPFIRSLIPRMWAPSSRLNHLPRVPPPNPTTWGSGFQHMNFGGNTNVQSITSCIFKDGREFAIQIHLLVGALKKKISISSVFPHI